MPWRRNKGGGYRTGKGGNVKKPKQYEALRRRGLSKTAAARITNAGKRAQRKGGKRSR
jgi:hypothetical protein